VISPRNRKLLEETFPALKNHPFPAVGGEDLDKLMEVCRRSRLEPVGFYKDETAGGGQKWITLPREVNTSPCFGWSVAYIIRDDLEPDDSVEHLAKIAELVGEGDDIGAAWESVAQIIREHRAMRKSLLALADRAVMAEGLADLSIKAEMLASEAADLTEPQP